MAECLICVVLLIIYSSASADKCSSNQEKKIEFDTTCSTNCSQEPPRIGGDTVFFNCSIGIQKDVDRYRKVNKKQFLPESSVFDAPMIRGVELYWKSFPDLSELSLKFNFSLPKGFINPNKPDDWRVPQAVLLKFKGKTKDDFYTKCPRERIFQFHNYKATNFYEMSHPRQLMFDCLVGLEGNVYAITLQTAEGKQATYITTVTDRAENGLRSWRPVIMTYLNETDGSLYTVVEKPPSTYNVQSYSVSLVQNGHRVIRTAKIDLKERNSTTFTNLTNGQYTVKVTPLCGKTCPQLVNRTTESVIIDASMLPGKPFSEEYPHYLEDTLEPMKVAAMVTGCIMGITLLLSITYCIRKRPKCQEHSSVASPSGLLLHPFECGSMTGEYDVVLKLKRYIDEACDCTVTDCSDLHSGRAQFGQSETLGDRVDKTLRDCTFVLVLYSSNCFNAEATSYITDFYSCVLKAAVDRKSSHNDIRVVLLQFPFNSNNNIPAVIRSQNIPVVNFIKDPDKAYCKMHGFDKRPPKTKSLKNENLSQWSDLWTELNKTVRQVRNNSGVESDESEPLSQYIENGEIVTGRVLDKFKQIAMINVESDSLIGNEDTTFSPMKVEQFKGYNQKSFHPHTKETENSKTEGSSRNASYRQPLESLGETFEQPEDYNKGKHKQPSVQLCEAVVHYSGDNTATSYPLQSRRPDIHHNDQPLSLPADFAHHQKGSGKNDEIHSRKLGLEKQHNLSNKEQGHIKGPGEFVPVMKFNAEDPDFEGCVIDEEEINDLMEIDEVEGTHFQGTHSIPPVLHGNVHHHPYHCHHGVLDHRNPVHTEDIFHEFQPDQLTDQPYMHNHGNLHFGRQRTNHRPPHFPQGMTHQKLIQHGLFHQYHQNDCISNPNHGEAFPVEFEHPHKLDQENFTDLHHHHHHPHHQQQYYHHHHHHLNNLQQFNKPDQYFKPQASREQHMCSYEQDKNFQSPISFDAFDPPSERIKRTDQTEDTDKKHEHTKQNATDFTKVSSIHSLPTELEGGKWIKPGDYGSFSLEPPSDFHSYSPEPPEDVDNISHSQIMDQMMQINKNSI